jgi:RNA polymerase sigma-70 factor, ECF subfamily
VTPAAPDPPAVLDEAALERLYVRLERRLYNVVYRWVWSAEDASEIVQEAFVRLWKMRDEVRMDSVEALVYRIAVNLASKRRRYKRIRSFLGWVDEAGADPMASVDERLGRAQRSLAVRSAVERLPERLRQPVMLCAFSGLPYKAVGEILGIPPGTVASRRNQALAILRDELREVDDAD